MEKKTYRPKLHENTAWKNQELILSYKIMFINTDKVFHFLAWEKRKDLEIDAMTHEP